MAKIHVCDRCLVTPLTEDTAFKFNLHLDQPMGAPIPGYLVTDVELCGDCALVVRNLSSKMKLGPDAVEGGVRKMKRKPKDTEADTE